MSRQKSQVLMVLNTVEYFHLLELHFSSGIGLSIQEKALKARTSPSVKHLKNIGNQEKFWPEKKEKKTCQPIFIRDKVQGTQEGVWLTKDCEN